MNKSLITAGQIIAGITSIYVAMYSGVIAAFSFFNATLVYVLVLSIIALAIIGIIQLQSAKTGKISKDAATGWAILLIIVGGLGGILALIGVLSKGNGDVTTNSVEKSLVALNRLFDQGFISLEEYQKRREQIIKKIN